MRLLKKSICAFSLLFTANFASADNILFTDLPASFQITAHKLISACLPSYNRMQSEALTKVRSTLPSKADPNKELGEYIQDEKLDKIFDDIQLRSNTCVGDLEFNRYRNMETLNGLIMETKTAAALAHPMSWRDQKFLNSELVVEYFNQEYGEANIWLNSVSRGDGCSVEINIGQGYSQIVESCD